MLVPNKTKNIPKIFSNLLLNKSVLNLLKGEYKTIQYEETTCTKNLILEEILYLSSIKLIKERGNDNKYEKLPCKKVLNIDKIIKTEPPPLGFISL